jgi:Peptidase family M48
MGARELLLGLSLCAVVGCATTSSAPKAREITPAERSSLSGTLEPLLTAAGLWRGPADACAAAFGVLEGDVVGVALAPHAPCRVRLVLTEETLTRLDRATLRVLLAHEIAHMQLGHPDARQARADAQKQTQQGVKSAASVGSKAAGLIPGIGGFISKGIGTARKATTMVMEMHGNPYLPGEEQPADAMAVTFLNEGEPASCRALTGVLAERLRSPDEAAWAPWLHAHPVSAERIEALAGPCPGSTSRANPGMLASAIERRVRGRLARVC